MGVIALLACWGATTFTVLAADPASAAGKPVELAFERQVRPILKAHCFHCHGEEPKPKGRLDLRRVRWMVRGGTSGGAISPGDHEASLLWERIDADEMPPGAKKLTGQEKATITQWIDQGARTLRPEPDTATLTAAEELTEEDRNYWAFQPVRRPRVPQVRQADRVGNPIDAFLLAKLEDQSLSFAPEADRATLLRRLAFDLTGLPATPEETARFLSDDAPDAFERLVDRLLASPAYGERWARHWLDVVGHADSDGYTAKDPERPHAWRYRDYLVRAHNADRPWSELIAEQLAGDELLKPPYANLQPTEVDALIATGFLRAAPDGTADGEVDQKTARNDVIAETIKIVSSSFLGMTVGCAQCHAHRYDPIPHDDYYRLRAVFEPALDWKNWRVPSSRLVSLWTDVEKDQAKRVDAEVREVEAKRRTKLEELVAKVLEKELNAAPEDLRSKLREARETSAGKRSAEQKELLKRFPRVNVSVGNVSLYDGAAHRAITQEFDKMAAAAKAKRPAEEFVACLTEIPGQVPKTMLFARGDFNQPRNEVEPGELTVVATVAGPVSLPLDDPSLPTTGRRLAYARHLTSGRHPLVARVLVNRVWMQHFGQGIVRTPGDFGHLGERPTHPELLDWLADEFVRQGWRLKPLHRAIVTSTAYRQATTRDPRLDAVDPENRLLGRMSIRRLEAEEVRDAMLAVSGALFPRMAGPAVSVAVDEVGQVIVGKDNRDTAGRPQGPRESIGPEEFRRGLYIQIRRSLPVSLLETFDAPTLTPNCEKRAASTSASQSLMLMNNDFVARLADQFATRVEAEVGATANLATRARLAWRLALGRQPSESQMAAAVQFLDAAWGDFAEAATRSATTTTTTTTPPVAEPGRPNGRRNTTASPSPPASPEHRALASFCHALMASNAFLYVD